MNTEFRVINPWELEFTGGCELLDVGAGPGLRSSGKTMYIPGLWCIYSATCIFNIGFWNNDHVSIPKNYFFEIMCDFKYFCA